MEQNIEITLETYRDIMFQIFVEKLYFQGETSLYKFLIIIPISYKLKIQNKHQRYNFYQFSIINKIKDKIKNTILFEKIFIIWKSHLSHFSKTYILKISYHSLFTLLIIINIYYFYIFIILIPHKTLQNDLSFKPNPKIVTLKLSRYARVRNDSRNLLP